MPRNQLKLAALVFFMFVSAISNCVLTTHAQSPSPTPTAAATSRPTPAPSASPLSAAPKVIGVEGNLELDDLIRVEIDHFSEWAANNDTSKLVPYLNGLAIHGNFPAEIHASQNHLQFHLQNTAENRKVWIDLLGEPHSTRKAVAFSVGPYTESPFDSVYDSQHPLWLTVINPPYGVIALVVVTLTLILLVLLGVKTNLIREAGVCPVPG